MKKTICMITFCALASAALWAQDRPKLSFRADGKFKIAQFTDLHWTHGAVTCARTAATIKAVLEAEKPDMAILTGDVVWRTPDREPWTDIPKIFEDARTPFAVVFGNHDAEGGTKITRAEIMDILLRSPWFIGEKGPDDIHGVGNYILPVYGSKSNRPAALLYCFDSNAYDPKYGPNAPVYFDQIAWYRRQSDAITAGNDGTPLPALAFFHIPLPEYNNLIGERNTLGTNGEKPCPPNFNTGLLSAFIDREDVMGAFVGHDHDNDYIGLEGHIALAYGRVSGWEAYGKMERGARIIELSENEFAFDTWIRTPQGCELTFYYPSAITSVDEETMTYLPAKPVKPGERGVRYVYYEGRFGSVKEITPDKRVSEGVMPYLSIIDAPSEDYFAYEFRTWINIPERAVYSFYTISDDGSQLYIDDRLVVDKDWSHVARVNGKIALEAGFHELKVLFYEATWGQGLEVGYSSKKIRDRPLPEDQLFLPAP